MSQIPVLPLAKALTIATSDSGGGAGIQADLKTFAALGVYGLCVLSGVSAQNTVAVTGLELLSPALVKAQLEAVFDDIGVDAVKIGLLGSPENTLAARDYLSSLAILPPVVLDPVMVSASGHAFLAPEAIEALKSLMPLAKIVTPNLPEAGVLAGMDLSNPSDLDIIRAAEKILALGAKKVLVKGGHGKGLEARDLLFGEGEPAWISLKRVNTPNNHGTGCTLSSAIASHLAKGEELEEAVRKAKSFVTKGLEHSIALGRGPGPLNHFCDYYDFKGASPDDKA